MKQQKNKPYKNKIMIHLNLGIYDGDVQIIKFFTLNELCEYL